MNWEELIGFLISIAAFLFLMFRGVFKERQRVLEEETEEELIPEPPPVKKVKKKHSLPPPRLPERSIVSSHYEELAKSTPYEVVGKAGSSRVHRILSTLKSKKDMVVLKEIIGPPKGL